MEVVVTTGAIGRAKLHQRTNIQFFTGRMPFLSPNQQCQSIEVKNITSNELAYPKLGVFPTLSLTTNTSWLPWRRVAMPLISPLMPVPRYLCVYIGYLYKCFADLVYFCNSDVYNKYCIYTKPIVTDEII